MHSDAVRKFFLGLGSSDSELVEREKWINTFCPLAPWTHGSGIDTKPSAGISVSEKTKSVFYCFGCSDDKPIGLAELIFNMYALSGSYPWEAAEIFAREENHGHGKSQARPPDGWEDRKPASACTLPKWVVRSFPLLQDARGYEAKRAMEWLVEERLIAEWVVNYCQIRLDPDRQALVFPLTDLNGKIHVLRKRQRKAKKMWTVAPKEFRLPDEKWPTIKLTGVWFGLHLIDWSRPVMVVEGELDAMRLMTLGFRNVVASATSSVSKSQMQALTADTIFLGYDRDHAGIKANKRIAEELEGKANFFVADWSRVRKEDGTRCEDPGDLPDEESLKTVLRGMMFVGN